MTSLSCLRFGALLFLCALLSGCANQKAWVYAPNTYPAARVTTNKKAVVLPLEDARSNQNQDAWLLYMIPPMPCGWQHFNVPEGSSMHIVSGAWHNYRPTEDYAKALAEELKRTGLFSEAYFDFRKSDSDITVAGRILSSKYDGYIYSYCLSVYGPFLWFIGLPAASTRNELSVELSARDSRTDALLLTKVYTATPRESTSWIYVMKNDFNYAEMLAEVNKQFCTDLEAN